MSECRKNLSAAHENARNIFEEIFSIFPDLTVIKEENEHVEISYIIPVQQGLAHEVCLNLQNKDELHFSVGGFWSSWFPCEHREVVERYKDAIILFLSGEGRILEYYKGSKCTKAFLQKHENGQWVTLSSSHHVSFFRFWMKETQKVVWNRKV